MIHILIGAGIGAVVGAASVIVLARMRGEPIRWRSVVSNAIGGAVGGAITAATLGAGTVASVGIARTVGGFAVGGFGGGAALQSTDNVLEGRPLTENVLETAIDCTMTSVVAGGAGKIITPLARAAGTRIGATNAGSRLAPVTSRLDEGVIVVADNIDTVKDATELAEVKDEEDEARANAEAEARAAEARAAEARAAEARAAEARAAEARAAEARAAEARAAETRAAQTRRQRAQRGRTGSEGTSTQPQGRRRGLIDAVPGSE